MQYRVFGKTGWKVSEIGFGGARIGGLLAQDGGRKASLATLAAALDAGINFYDTADMYSQGESEVLIGKAFRKARDKVFIASKGGYCTPAGKKLIQFVKPLAKPIVQALGLRRVRAPSSGAGPIPQDFSPGYLRKAAEASLRRLGTDYIDLYQMHSPSPEMLRSAQFQDTLGLLAELKAEGKIRHYGIALDAVDDARHCFGLEGISSLQIPFGILDMEALDDGVFEEASKRQLGIIARGCFAGGALKGSLTEAELRASEPKWERVLKLRRLVERLGRSPTEAALQFSLREPRIGVNIIGMRTLDQLATNLQHYSRPLSDEEFHKLLTYRSAAEA
ncbi:aldo/keto reductase [Hyphomicrobium sp.]|uniref:aldo/keto reductase n=1 Tax=Hyphomicrobium sp. TaxID=82 RepID=UPI001D3C8459|nr:aldo/keto reductase [Hyphomicrobium sp.]MBY0561298.1 aldo/keto reductase [Hyphomicrobium sp.]